MGNKLANPIIGEFVTFERFKDEVVVFGDESVVKDDTVIIINQVVRIK